MASDDVTSLRDTIIPKSDQLNADDLLAGPITVIITGVRRGSAEQPIDVMIAGRQPYKPCKSMRRALITAWGDDGRAWVGRAMTLYADPEVKFGGVKVGGIRVSHLSHIERDLHLSLTATKGKRAPHTIEQMPGFVAAMQGSAALQSWWKKLTAAQKAELKPILDGAWKPIAQGRDAPSKPADTSGAPEPENVATATPGAQPPTDMLGDALLTLAQLLARIEYCETPEQLESLIDLGVHLDAADRTRLAVRVDQAKRAMAGADA